MTQPSAAVPLQDTLPDTALWPDCGAETAVDEDHRLQPHGGYEGKLKVCAGGGKAAGHVAAPLFPRRPSRAVRPAARRVTTVTFQTDRTWRTRLTCGTCPKTETVTYATFEPVLMPVAREVGQRQSGTMSRR